jgi:hypothetical protein
MLAFHLLVGRDEAAASSARAATTHRDRRETPECPTAPPSPAHDASVRRLAVEELLTSSQWAQVRPMEAMLDNPRDRVEIVRALATRGIHSLEEAREHPMVARVRNTLLRLIRDDAGVAAIRRIQTRGTWRGRDDAIVVALADQLARSVVPVVLDRRDVATSRTLRGLAPIRDARTAERARAVIERSLPSARAHGVAHVLSTTIRVLDRLVRQMDNPTWFLVDEIAGDPDPDEASYGLLGAVPRERLAAVGSALLLALAEAARLHPIPPPPPPPPLPPAIEGAVP